RPLTCVVLGYRSRFFLLPRSTTLMCSPPQGMGPLLVNRGACFRGGCASRISGLANSEKQKIALRHDEFVTQTHIFAPEPLRTDTNTFIFHCVFWHSRCSPRSPMMNNGASLKQGPQSRTFYSNALRCIGQSLESMELKAVEVKTHGDNYIIQAWNKGTSTSMDIERHC